MPSNSSANLRRTSSRRSASQSARLGGGGGALGMGVLAMRFVTARQSTSFRSPVSVESGVIVVLLAVFRRPIGIELREAGVQCLIVNQRAGYTAVAVLPQTF